jgi:hypothetical protein
VRGDVPINSDTLSVTDFVNLKIKPIQSFIGAHRGSMCIYVSIEVNTRTCMSIYIYTIFLKKNCLFMIRSNRVAGSCPSLSSLGKNVCVAVGIGRCLCPLF